MVEWLSGFSASGKDVEEKIIHYLTQERFSQHLKAPSPLHSAGW
jgi:hypothetical protein